MDVGSVIRLLHWFVPIPFMILYHIQTKKLEWFKGYTFVFTLIFGSLLLSFLSPLVLGFRPELIMFYVCACLLSFLFFTEKYTVPQALSIAVCLTFFASLYWEIPYHIFTIISRGYFDQALPLHMLYAFPGVFIWQKIKIKTDSLDAGLIGISLGISTLGLILLVDLGVDVFLTYKNPANLWYIAEVVFLLTRVVCFSVLYIIFFRGSLRRACVVRRCC